MCAKNPAALVVLLLAGFAFGQSVNDPTLKVQTWATGFANPTGMAFLPDGRALVLEKETGEVKIMADRQISGTALDLAVSSDSERGLLGIALSPTFDQDQFVYLYFTAAQQDGGAPISNSVKRYQWNGSTLDFKKKVIDLPATPGPNHDGGRITFGPDGKLYIGIGDLNRNELTSNHDNGVLNRVGAVLRVNSSGSSVTTNPFFNANNTGKKKARNDLFAYGIRNTFGMDFDPASGTLWMSENGPSSFDEINRITPGFNGGWESILGPTSRNGEDPSQLVSFGERARYGDPKFSWAEPVAPTDMFFMPTSRLGSQYRNDLFVATFKDGAILKFDLSPSRKTLVLDGGLADLVADNDGGDPLAEQDDQIFAQGFDAITDLVAGPGGMYVLSFNDGIIYRITTKTAPSASSFEIASAVVPEPSASILIPAILLALTRFRLARAATRGVRATTPRGRGG